MDLILFKDNPRALTGYKGREDIADIVYGSLHAKEKIKFYTARSILDYDKPKEIDNLKYWSDRAVENIRKLKTLKNIYVKAYPKKGELLFGKIVQYCKINWERLEEMHTRRDYYWRRSMDAFNEGGDTDYWNQKLNKLDEEIHKLENAK